MTPTGAASGTPRRADATSNAARIVEAARRVFTRGDGLGSLDEIAREAGVGIATLYRHFARREVLASAVYRQLFDEEIVPALERARHDPSPIHGLRSASEGLLALLSRAHGLVASTANVAALTDELLREFRAPLDELVLAAQRAGEMREDIEGEDIPRLLGMVIAGLTVPGLPAGAQQRYVALMFDALAPAHATPLPPLTG